MRSEKLSTKDWTSPRLRLIDRSIKPSANAEVEVSCYNCNKHKSFIYKELIRRVNCQSEIVEHYHCPECYNNHPKSQEKRRNISEATRAKIKNGASERSKQLWLDPIYKEKQKICKEELKKNKEFAIKVSEAIKSKFANDQEYVKKVQIARTKYHQHLKNPRTWDKNKFISVSNSIHNNIYNYEKVEYITTKQKVEVVCSRHGSFWVRPSHHIYYKNGCPKCNNEKTQSNGEIELFDYVSSIYKGKIIQSDRSILNGMELDIWIPEYRLGIEYHGAWFHSTTHLNNKNYHSIKSTLANKNNINLLQFVDLDLNYKIEIAKSMISNKLGLNKKIYARKCMIKCISNREAFEFFKNSHYHGAVNATVAYGLFNEDNLVSVLSFRTNGNIAEISRYATILYHNVVGGFSRLMNHFITSHPNIDEIFTYVDRNFTTLECCYSKFGMQFEGITKPGYRYLKNNKLYNRRSFQKYKLKHLLDKFDPSKTEFGNMVDNGYRILFDAGNLKYRMSMH